MQFNLAALKRLVVILTLFCWWPHLVHADKLAHILVIANLNTSPYQEALAGFKEQTATYGKIKYTELTLEQASSAAVKEIEGIKPDLIYALGSEATDLANQKTTRIPIVTTLVLKDDVFKKSANITGVSLSYSFKIQFQWLKKFFPRKKTVAILYNPGENAATVRDASTISQQEGLKLVAIPVETPKELPYALDQLANNIDIFMAIPDETVMSIKTSREVLLASFSNKVPLVGLSDNWVQTGALYALSWDFNDLGRQCAVQAIKILSGATVQSVPPEHPRKITYSINAKIAEHLDIEIPGDLLKNAKIVY
jgi:putative tryptophan/tyrosine transport system substrate-binding protein